MFQIFASRSAAFAAAVVFIAGCETLPPNPISPSLYQQLKVTEVTVTVPEDATVDWVAKVAEYEKENGLEPPEVRSVNTKKRIEEVRALKAYNQRIREEMRPVIVESIQENVAAAVSEQFIDGPNGNVPIKIDVVVNSFIVPGAGQLLISGGDSELSGVAAVSRLDSGEALADYDILVMGGGTGGGLDDALASAFTSRGADKSMGRSFAKRLKYLMERPPSE